MPRLTAPTLKEYLEKNKRITPDGCWEWHKRSNSNYTQIGYHYKRLRVHVASAIVFLGYNLDNVDGIQVLHKCDNGHCWNPDHLFLGTRSDNMKDCVSKNRHAGWRHKRRITDVTT